MIYYIYLVINGIAPVLEISIYTIIGAFIKSLKFISSNGHFNVNMFLLLVYKTLMIHNIYVDRYRGHVPTMKFDYCETYGNHTVKYFQDYRSSVLNSSKSNFCKGGYFPTYYSYNSDLATEARTRKWDRWLQVPAYSLSNMDHDRREELIQFNKVR